LAKGQRWAAFGQYLPYLPSDFTYSTGTRELDYLFPSPTNEITYFGLVTRELDYLFPSTTE